MSLQRLRIVQLYGPSRGSDCCGCTCTASHCAALQVFAAANEKPTEEVLFSKLAATRHAQRIAKLMTQYQLRKPLVLAAALSAKPLAV